MLPVCRERGVRVFAAAVFNSGLLATEDPRGGERYDYGPVPEDVMARTREVVSVCSEFDVPLPVAALHYPLLDETVIAVVVGAASAGEVRANARALTTDVPDDLWRRLRALGLIP